MRVRVRVRVRVGRASAENVRVWMGWKLGDGLMERTWMVVDAVRNKLDTSIAGRDGCRAAQRQRLQCSDIDGIVCLTGGVVNERRHTTELGEKKAMQQFKIVFLPIFSLSMPSFCSMKGFHQRG